MSSTITALFDSRADAEAAKDRLKSARIDGLLEKGRAEVDPDVMTEEAEQAVEKSQGPSRVRPPAARRARASRWWGSARSG